VAAETEVTSETKRREGRPARFSDETMAFVATLYPEVHSRRGLVDIAYRQRAIEVLKVIPACHWLCDFEGMVQGNDSAWQPGILMELGRIDDIDAMIAVAIEVCERQPPREEAIRLVRRYRGAPRAPQTSQLAIEIVDTINSYIKRYPQTTWEGIHDALALAQVACRAAQEDTEQPSPIEGEESA